MTTTGKAKAAATVALGNLAGVVALALSDGKVTSEETGSIVGSIIFGIISVYAVWKVRNNPVPIGNERAVNVDDEHAS